MPIDQQFLTDVYRQRTTLPLRATKAKHRASLDFKAALSIQYAQAWLNRQEEGVPYPNVFPKVPLGGVMRRALEVYMEHLGKADTDLNTEAFLMRLACVSPGTPPGEWPACLERLATAFTGPAPVPFKDVVRGPQGALCGPSCGPQA